MLISDGRRAQRSRSSSPARADHRLRGRPARIPKRIFASTDQELFRSAGRRQELASRLPRATGSGSPGPRPTRSTCAEKDGTVRARATAAARWERGRRACPASRTSSRTRAREELLLALSDGTVMETARRRAKLEGGVPPVRRLALAPRRWPPPAWPPRRGGAAAHSLVRSGGGLVSYDVGGRHLAQHAGRCASAAAASSSATRPSTAAWTPARARRARSTADGYIVQTFCPLAGVSRDPDRPRRPGGSGHGRARRPGHAARRLRGRRPDRRRRRATRSPAARATMASPAAPATTCSPATRAPTPSTAATAADRIVGPRRRGRHASLRRRAPTRWTPTAPTRWPPTARA